MIYRQLNGFTCIGKATNRCIIPCKPYSQRLPLVLASLHNALISTFKFLLIDYSFQETSSLCYKEVHWSHSLRVRTTSSKSSSGRWWYWCNTEETGTWGADEMVKGIGAVDKYTSGADQHSTVDDPESWGSDVKYLATGEHTGTVEGWVGKRPWPQWFGEGRNRTVEGKVHGP